MRFMEEKAAERHPDCLVFSSAVLQVCKCIQVLLYSSGRLLAISPYSSRSCKAQDCLNSLIWMHEGHNCILYNNCMIL